MLKARIQSTLKVRESIKVLNLAILIGGERGGLKLKLLVDEAIVSSSRTSKIGVFICQTTSLFIRAMFLLEVTQRHSVWKKQFTIDDLPSSLSTKSRVIVRSSA